MNRFLYLSFLIILSSSCKQQNSSEIKGELLNKVTVADTNMHKYLNSFKHPDTNTIDYPDYFGGAYINNQYDLVFNIVGDTSKYKKDIIQRIGNDNFHLKKCRYSYKHLIEANDSINQFIQNHKNTSTTKNIGFYNSAISIEQNVVIVQLIDNSPDKIDLFEASIYKSPTIIFMKANISEVH